jgi:predicted GTPase
LAEAEKEADVLLSMNDDDMHLMKFDLLIVVVNPLRADNGQTHHQEDTSIRIADILLINNVNATTKEQIENFESSLHLINNKAKIVHADSVMTPDNPRIINGKRVLIVEDESPEKHADALLGAGRVVAELYGAKEIVSAKKYAVGAIKSLFENNPRPDIELPAAYGPKEVRDLEATLNNADCDVIVSATSINLRSIINVTKPIVQIRYELKPKGRELDDIIDGFVKKIKK